MNRIVHSVKTLLKSIIGFDESIYLKLNPDVFEAVQKGDFSSGWQHFIHFGLREKRPGFPSKLFVDDEKIFEASYAPIPPAHLRKRVQGHELLSRFIKVGELVAGNILDTINQNFELNEQSHILDFGCGCGRIIREFHKSFIHGKFYGTDIDQEAIVWCRQNISQIGEFVTNEELPPLPFDDEFFDFVYSISVFTHLPEDMQFAWLDELRRVTKLGGYLLLTTHGDEPFPGGPERIHKKFRETGFHYSRGAGMQGLPDFYQTTFHTEAYIRRQWSQFFEIIMIKKKGIGGRQDLILCKRTN